jgi:drug/metabolite transporter (DMT)-like permease
MFRATATFFLAVAAPSAEVSTSPRRPLIIIGWPTAPRRAGPPSVIAGAVLVAGVVILVGIDPSHIELATLVPLATATSYALFSLLTRALHDEPPDVTLFYSGLVSMIAATVLFAIAPRDPMPEPWQWVGIGIVGLAALTGHRLLVGAYRWGRASDLAPLGYLSLVWSFIIGAIVFGEPVSPGRSARSRSRSAGSSRCGAARVPGAVRFRSTSASVDLEPRADRATRPA